MTDPGPASGEPGEPWLADDVRLPVGLEHPSFRLVPLGPEHNASDHDAWMSSIEHIRATPGFSERGWPSEMSAQDNRSDLEMHARHFRDRVGFTYTVLAPDADDVLGCVYIYPDDTGATDAHVKSWVRADHAELDRVLHDSVRAWLDEDWPFETYTYAPR